MLGSGAIIVADDTVSIPEMALRAFGGEDPFRVPGADQIPGRLHDPAQHGRQGQLLDDRAIGDQQLSQPLLSCHVIDA